MKKQINPISSENPYLETQKQHKDWYKTANLGKQRGKPKANAPKTEKPKGTRKHSLRKEA